MNRRLCVLSFVVVGMAFSAGLSALAQQMRTGMPTRLRSEGPLDLALMEPVLKELGIENDTAKIAEIRKLQEAKRRELVSTVRDLRGKDRAQMHEIGLLSSRPSTTPN